ncbi:MAG: helix-turn-helix transcriptional regulator [Actinomycetota bacterium]
MMCDSDTGNSKCSCHSGRMGRFLIPALLLLLAEKPSHGYELSERYSELGFTEAESDPGAIYRNLRLLEKEGFIKARWETKGQGPAKKVYSITAEGTELLSSWAREIGGRKNILESFLERFKKLKIEL